MPVWGKAVPGSKVKVSLGARNATAITGVDGNWSTMLDPLEAGGPFELQVRDDTKTIRLVDVMAGEVWFGSGQSNMEVSIIHKAKTVQKGEPVYECDQETKQFMESNLDPRIRISSVTKAHSTNPAWTPLSSENYQEAPATMTCLAILIQKQLNVSVGIVVRAENSSPTGIWISREEVESDPAIQSQITTYALEKYPKLLEEYPAALKAFEDGKSKAKPPLPPPAGDTPTWYFTEGRLRNYGCNYAAQIAPVIPYAVRGIVWDQGESLEGIAGAEMTAVLPALVRSWRLAWGRHELPFFYFRKNQHPAGLPQRMQALGHVQQIDNTGLKQEIHPPDKLAYAQRLFEAIHARIYQSAKQLPEP